MKKKLGVMLLVVALALVLILPAAPVVASTGSIVGLWHLDEGSGTIAADSSGYDNNGTVYGATTGVDGKFGKALSFDGVNHYVNAGGATSFDFTDKFTVEAWINGEAFQANYYDLIVFRGYNNWAFGVDRAKRLMFGEAAWNSYFSRQIYSDALSWTTGQWYHIAVVYDTVGKTADFYRDGVPVGVGKQSTDKLGITNSGNVTISYPHSVSFNGIIDEVRIWDGALTDTEIAYNYSLGDVGIDIKPGSDPNSINLGSKGVIPVAILSSADFDASTVDPFTITLADVAVKVKGKSGNAGSLEDVNDDGLLDLVVHVYTEGLALSAGDVETELHGETYGGMPIIGNDSIRIVPPQ